MGITLGDRLAHAWNAFMNKDPTENIYSMSGEFRRPDRLRLNYGNDRSIVTSIYNRIAVDTAAIAIQHVKVDENNRYLETVNDKLNGCLTADANIDQTGKQLIKDIVMSMCDEGCVAVVPVDTEFNPFKSDSIGIKTLRTGKIIEWYPDRVKVLLYNDKTGRKQEIIVLKKFTAIIENPFHAIMNEPNSLAKRLIRKINLLDQKDEMSGSGKLDLILKMPYIVKSKSRREQVEERRKELENQINNSKYGVAWTDGTEQIQQLSRPLENNLLEQIKYLTSMLYSQLGQSDEILNGKADEKTMLNYYNHAIEPFLDAITEEMDRKFLTKTARSQGHRIKYYRDYFKLVPINNIADTIDKLTRNEVVSSNEARSMIGFKPVQNPQADELRNKNLYGPESENQIPMSTNDGQNGGENYETGGQDINYESSQ